MPRQGEVRGLGFWNGHPRLQAIPGVFVGGMIGTGLRGALSNMQPSVWAWPWMTFCVNMAGAMLLGFLLEYLARTGEDVGLRRHFRLFAGTGVMGGFTTYGTFILETDTRFMGAQLGLGIGYAMASVILGLACAALGIAAAARLTAHSEHQAGEGQQV